MLATTEVQQLLDEEGLSLAQLPDVDREVTAAGVPAEQQDDSVYGYPGGAGGYLEFIFRCWKGWKHAHCYCSARISGERDSS